MKYPPLILSISSLLLAGPAMSQDKAATPAETKEVPTVKIENKALNFTVDFEAVVLPKAVKGSIFLPKAWKSFSVLEALPHGSPVTKGESVIKVDTESLENAIVDQKSAVDSVKLSLEEAKTALERLKRDQKLARESSERYLKRLSDDHKRYLEISVPMEKSDSEFNMSQRERRLQGEVEELKQLTAMYEEDELTEETEEIILERAKASVADAEYMLKKAKIAAKKDLEIDLVRAIENYQLTVDKAKREAADKEADRKVELQRKKMALDAAQRSYDRAAKKLADLESDLELSSFPADKSGHVFYGIVEAGGKWNFAETSKRLVRGGSLAPRQPLFTIVPEDAELILSALVTSEQAQKLEYAKTGYASLGGSQAMRTPVTLNPTAERPLMNGQYRITLDLEPAEFLNPSSKLKVKLTGSSKEEGPVVPKSAVKIEEDGSLSVMLQNEEDEFEKRGISAKFDNKTSIMVSKGLKAGEIVKKSAK